MQTVSFKIWTRIAKTTFYDDNRFAKFTSKVIRNKKKKDQKKKKQRFKKTLD